MYVNDTLLSVHGDRTINIDDCPELQYIVQIINLLGSIYMSHSIYTTDVEENL